MSFRKRSEPRLILNVTVSTILLMGMSTLSHSADHPFASNPDFTAASCVSGDKMYYISGNKAPSGSTYQSLSWNGGALSKRFTFIESSGNKVFTISFSAVTDKNNTQGGTTPFYGGISGATTNAINLAHNSPVSEISKTNHVLDISVNRSVTKMGYKIQDIDSTTIGSGKAAKTPYIEEVDISPQAGKLTFNPNFHTINTAKTIVTALKGKNCGLGGCTIDATWDYKTANSSVSLKHNNVMSETDSAHAVAYSDFYFCLAPPKVIVKKELNGSRINDTNLKRDQFEISIKNGSTILNSFTTTGVGPDITTGSSSAITLKEATTYTITERVLNGSVPGNINDYNVNYTCTNATTDSTTILPTGTSNSFTLLNLNYGDEITCILTNTPGNYTFTGYVFNDNGGIVASDNNKQDISSTFTGNKEYFNGLFERNKEVGIADSNLSVSLTDCSGNNIITSSPNPQTVSSAQATLGQYSFAVAPTALAGKTKVCLIQSEPNSWLYDVDTTPNTREIALVAKTYDYKTEIGTAGIVTRNLDFGEVKASNTALVLIKSQYIHECKEDLIYTSINDNAAPTIGYSTNPATDVIPGQCIAYKIQAFNRGHVELQSIKIIDTLQTTPVKSSFHLPLPLGIAADINPYVSTLPIGIITSNAFNLADTQSPTVI